MQGSEVIHPLANSNSSYSVSGSTHTYLSHIKQLRGPAVGLEGSLMRVIKFFLESDRLSQESNHK
jgi:hypothetical protein